MPVLSSATCEQRRVEHQAEAGADRTGDRDAGEHRLDAPRRSGCPAVRRRPDRRGSRLMPSVAADSMSGSRAWMMSPMIGASQRPEVNVSLKPAEADAQRRDEVDVDVRRVAGHRLERVVAGQPQLAGGQAQAAVRHQAAAVDVDVDAQVVDADVAEDGVGLRVDRPAGSCRTTAAGWRCAPGRCPSSR